MILLIMRLGFLHEKMCGPEEEEVREEADDG